MSIERIVLDFNWNFLCKLCLKAMKNDNRNFIYLFNQKSLSQENITQLLSLPELFVPIPFFNNIVKRYGRKFYDGVFGCVKGIFRSYGCEIYTVINYTDISLLNTSHQRRDVDIDYAKLPFNYLKVVATTRIAKNDVINNTATCKLRDEDDTCKLRDEVEIGILFNLIFMWYDELNDTTLKWKTRLIQFDIAFGLVKQFYENEILPEANIANFESCYKNGNKRFMDALKDVLTILLVNYIQMTSELMA